VYSLELTSPEEISTLGEDGIPKYLEEEDESLELPEDILE
jgi:hypothetical protein